ncbi:MAG: polyamine aminopropyltransferase [Bacteroidales bacterium]|nr:polyamine aminopropyltransferase [Bacteroidales bacterium]
MAMDYWFSEHHTENVKFSVKVDKHLFTNETDLGRVDIFESPEFGKFLAVDGYIIFTEKDEFIYDEMLSHVPMAVNPKAKSVLVFGSGDGGVVEEFLKYDTIERIDLVEVNEGVIEACRLYFPETSGCLDDPRVTTYTENALRFIRHIDRDYDIIVVDSAGFYGPGESLLTREFYGSCFKALSDDGIMVNQHQSPFYDDDRLETQRAHKRIVDIFPISKIYQAHIPTYPSGYWLFGFASKKYHPTDDLKAEEWNRLGIRTDYYTTRLHRGCFALPAYVERMLKEVEDSE